MQTDGQTDRQTYIQHILKHKA